MSQVHPGHPADQEPVVTRRLTVDQELSEWLDKQDDPDQLIADLLYALRAYGDAQEAVECINQRSAQSGN